MKVSVLIPTYNEKENIEILIPLILDEFGRARFQGDVIVIDDSSDDGTADVVRRYSEIHSNVHLLLRKEKLGLGSAYIDGFRWTIEHLYPEYFVQMDADLSHPPDVLHQLVASITNGYNHVAIASRYVKGGGVEGWNLTRRVASSVANFLARIFLGLPVADCTSGYRALSKSAVEMLMNFQVASPGFSYQIESLYIFKVLRLRITEVPFTFVGRKLGKTKLTPWDVHIFLWTLLSLFFAGPSPKRT